jgi:hypothetical protein
MDGVVLWSHSRFTYTSIAPKDGEDEGGKKEKRRLDHVNLMTSDIAGKMQQLPDNTISVIPKTFFWRSIFSRILDKRTNMKIVEPDRTGPRTERAGKFKIAMTGAQHCGQIAVLKDVAKKCEQ